MNIWENAVITDKGLALLAKIAQGGTPLHITDAATGAGYVTPGLLQKQTAVTSPKQTIKYRVESFPEEGKCTVSCYLSNAEVTTGYTATQVGVFANDPDEGKVLFFIAQAIPNTGTIIPTAAESPGYSAEWTFTFQFAQADNVVIVVDPASNVTQAAMEEYIAGEIQAATIAEIDAAIDAAT